MAPKESRTEPANVEVAVGTGTTPRTLIGDEKDTGKRKYAAPGGSVEFEVRPSDAGFKLRTPSAKLLWKVKIDGVDYLVGEDSETPDFAVGKKVRLESHSAGILKVSVMK